ncbi:MAG: hypothetical protein A2092_12940 [Rhodobacteraceae bacterium GWE1_64_9]|nr:MAG: hypothetical protein A2092_12940 [Rhodobacteraceae bacterium GWE1_64_9]
MQDRIAEFEIHEKLDLAATFNIPEGPGGFHVFEWSIKVFRVDLQVFWPKCDTAAKAFAKDLEADDQIGLHHLAALDGPARTDARRCRPWQELGIGTDIGHEAIHLLRGIGQDAFLVMCGHKIFPARDFISGIG